MLQDIQPLHLDNHYDPDIKPANDGSVLVFRGANSGKELLIKIDDTNKNIVFPKVSDLKEILNKDISVKKEECLIYLFSIGNEKFFLLNPEAVKELFNCKDSLTMSDSINAFMPNDSSVFGEFSFCSMMSLRKEYLDPKHYVFAANTAYQLHEWYDVTKYCGKCGALNEHHKKERARICPKCGNVIYPRINPAVIIGVTDKDTNKIILTKYRTGFAHNALVAGFTEIGETLEETVQREVMEEVGLEVTNVRYYKSQPWGIASDILAGFFCDVAGNKDIEMDSSELKYAEWVATDDIELQPLDYSLTNEMMRLFKEKGYDGTVKI